MDVLRRNRPTGPTASCLASDHRGARSTSDHGKVRNFNSWNLDLRYVWRFTRGSELVALYRNSISSDNNEADISFGDNLNNLLEQPFGHLLSIKVIYFLDYNNIKTWLKKVS